MFPTLRLPLIAASAAAASLFGQPSNNNERPRARPLPPVSKDVQTGPAIGAKLPPFRLPDQQGKLRDLRSLSGKNGVLLYFVRSADW